MSAIDIDKISKIDKADMLKSLVDFPDQCVEAIRIGKDASISYKASDFNNVIFAGLGGSAIGAEVFCCLFRDELKVPALVSREYTLPQFVDDKTLLIIASYSGNTEETLSSYDMGLKKGAKMVCISSNGKVEELARKDNFPFVRIPAGLPPRCALGYSFFPLLGIFAQMGFIKDKSSDADETIKLLRKLRDEKLAPQVTDKDNLAKPIAATISGGLAAIYSASEHMGAVAVRWRGQIAENSKHLASHHLLPEMNHNEIVGWENPKAILKKITAVFLKDKDDHIRVKHRMEITEKLITPHAKDIVVLESTGESALARTFSLIYTGDWVSFYLSILNGVDPTPVERIGFLKGELAKIK
ncbi:MAG: bifunctional phosphoglucose/phosphomannose isomerase [Candidatus Omnitrophica bacterium]|nr:bifunctional phosphoglucose/phosphomannose isomerase [Candidatus Omnitrophota bacterium]